MIIANLGFWTQVDGSSGPDSPFRQWRRRREMSILDVSRAVQLQGVERRGFLIELLEAGWLDPACPVLGGLWMRLDQMGYGHIRQAQCKWFREFSFRESSLSRQRLPRSIDLDVNRKESSHERN